MCFYTSNHCPPLVHSLSVVYILQAATILGYVIELFILLAKHVLSQTPPGYEPSSKHELYLEHPGVISVFPGISLQLLTRILELYVYIE